HFSASQLCHCARHNSMPQLAPMIHRTSFLTLLAGFMSSALFLNAQDSKPAKSDDTSKPRTGIVKATIETSKGTIELELDADKAPKTVANFVNYVKKGHYEGTIFHRVIPGFMIQGGGFTAD